MKLSFEEAKEFFSVLYFGEHHLPAEIKPYGCGWCINHYGGLSTYDFDTLTRLVFLAHDKCIRVSILQGGPRCIKIALWKRERRGSINTRHPTIEETLGVWRKGGK